MTLVQVTSPDDGRPFQNQGRHVHFGGGSEGEKDWTTYNTKVQTNAKGTYGAGGDGEGGESSYGKVLPP